MGINWKKIMSKITDSISTPILKVIDTMDQTNKNKYTNI